MGVGEGGRADEIRMGNGVWGREEEAEKREGDREGGKPNIRGEWG